jgi:acetolactate synthase-1/3 small subunit
MPAIAESPAVAAALPWPPANGTREPYPRTVSPNLAPSAAVLVGFPAAYYHCLFPFFVEFALMRHVLSAIVQNVPGVLAHVSGMLASRGYNIDSLAVGETEDANLSRMTFVVVGDDRILDQVRKQLEKIVTVVQVDDISSRDHVERDLMLLKVEAPPGSKRTEIRELVEIFRARIVDVGAEEVMIEISGRESKIEAFIQRMRPYGILELVRTGRIAMVRGKHRQPKTEEEAEEQSDQMQKVVG